MSNTLWKLSEEEEKENDYKRLQKKFAFIGQNKNQNNINPNVTNNDKFPKPQIQYKYKPDIKNSSESNSGKKHSHRQKTKIDNEKLNPETSMSLKMEEINKIIDQNGRNLRNSNQISQSSVNKSVNENDNNSKIAKSTLNNDDLTERNINRYIDNLDNNPGLAEAVNKMSESSFDSINDQISLHKNSYPQKVSLNLQLPPSNLVHNSYEDDPYFDVYQENMICPKVKDSGKGKADNNDSNQDSFMWGNNRKGKKSAFFHNPVYNLSSRLINDEKDHNKEITRDTKFKFIDKIKHQKINELKINPKLFIKMSDEAFYNFLSFSFDNYDKLKSSHPIIGYKLHLTFTNKYSKIIEEFRTKYSNYLELQDYRFKYDSIKRRKFETSGHIMNLILKSKIIYDQYNRNLDITMKYKNYQNDFDLMQSWRFDVRSQSNTSYWLASEAEEYQNNLIRYSYCQPIISVSKGDYIEFQLNIFSNNCQINPEEIKWEDIRIEKCPLHSFLDYEKNLIKNSMKFDIMRFCELENVIHVWKSEKSLSIKKTIDEVRKIFSKNFQIESVSYDFFKFYIYKVKMHAIEKGVVKKNKFLNFDMEIKTKNDPICIETRALGLLNSKTNKFEIRLGTPIIVYFTDIYL